MGKVAVMMAAGRADGPMSGHFGKAEWIMIANTEGGVPEFEKNHGLNGKSVADLLIRHGCTDAILVEIGEGALGHLRAAKILVWVAPGAVSGHEALRMFAEGRLSSVSSTCAPQDHGEGHGCCCSRRGASAASTSCCG
jgi:predicted Fe-Mo cluster-binding NifX family protein